VSAFFGPIGSTIFCACEGGEACENPLTQHNSELEASDMATHETDEDQWFDTGIITLVVVLVALCLDVLLK